MLSARGEPLLVPCVTHNTHARVTVYLTTCHLPASTFTQALSPSWHNLTHAHRVCLPGLPAQALASAVVIPAPYPAPGQPQGVALQYAPAPGQYTAPHPGPQGPAAYPAPHGTTLVRCAAGCVWCRVRVRLHAPGSGALSCALPLPMRRGRSAARGLVTALTADASTEHLLGTLRAPEEQRGAVFMPRSVA